MKTSSVYGWNRGVNALQNEAEKLSHDLGNLVKDMGQVQGGKGAAAKKGGKEIGGGKRDQFDIVTEKLKREIELLFDKGVKQIAAVPTRIGNAKDQPIESIWKAQQNKL